MLFVNTTDIILSPRDKGPLSHDSVVLARMIWTLCRRLNRGLQLEQSVLSQLLRSGTSVGANIREAQFAESKKDFIHKLKIAEKELGETYYWLGVMTTEPALVDVKELETILATALNVRRMLIAAINTARKS
ncbi:MAG: four helix bundle protein [Candidatus Kapabacteria bacterium]|nr:four helix bundle protein [Candidatus Kapabacteria bacterium]